MTIGKVKSFNIGTQNWDTYVRRVKQFMALNAIKSELHVATLVTVVGADCYDLMCDLCSPIQPESKTFDELVKLVKDHLEPERSEIAERHIFRQRKQQQGESIRSYLQSLKHLAKTCNFGEKLEENLRDQFVSALYSEEMRSRLFSEKNIDYKRAVELALALEAAERHASEACATTAGPAAASPGTSDGLHRVAGSGRARAARAAPGPASAASPAEPRRNCTRCGKPGHGEGRCRYKHYTCDKCGVKGHLKSVCNRGEVETSGNSGKKTNKGQFYLDSTSDSDSDDDSNFYNLGRINNNNNNNSYGCEFDSDRPYYVKLSVENALVKFEIDTGSKISAISQGFYDEMFLKVPIVKRILTFKSYTGDIIQTVGYIMVSVSYEGKKAALKLYIIKNGGPPLIGRTWIKELDLLRFNARNNHHYIFDENLLEKNLKDEFPEVFAEGLGTFKSQIRLHLKDDTPIFVKARPLPLALRERVERELDRLQREGVIYKVDRSDYGTPIVPVVKTNGDIRICGDYKVTINPRLKDFHYPLPRIEELFATLGGGEFYSKLDLSSAFQQCVLDESSRPMTAITTHVGTFVYNRVPFGIKCIPENFQKVMEETLTGLPFTTVFADDICVSGTNRSTHMTNLRAVLQRLKQNGLRINYAKCQFFKESVTYLGYRIDKHGLHTDEKKIKAIVAAPAPNNITQLRSFLGLVNFYSKFCKNMGDVLKPLYDLLKSDVTWNWSEDCKQAFSRIKKVLSSSPVLAHYNPSLQLILAVDSSPYGLGAVLLQRHGDGSERLICCASRTLNAAETNYSQLDKEALAIVFGVTKHHQYLYGRHFTLRSDHRALSYIFGEKKGIPVTAASRIQRYAVKLAAYNFKIEFIRSDKNSVADALSRLPLSSIKDRIRVDDEGYSYLNFVQEYFPLSFKDIKSEMVKDHLLSKIIGYVKFGWPHKASSDEEKAYFNRKETLHIDHGCLIWGYRIVIPTSLRETILKEVHDGHPGIVKMKQIARNYVWWETLDEDIERICSKCAACVSQRAQPAPAPLHSWPWPEEPWSRINVDFLGPFHSRYYLIIIDAHSKWIEVERVSSTSASAVIDCFRRIFARFGIPKRLVSDNGPPFSSVELATYLKHNGVKHLPVAPYHPSSNGAAENAVRTIKRVLKKAAIENVDDNTALSKFLFMYRNTEHGTTGREPAVAMLGRRLRGRLDLLRPDTAEVVRGAQIVQEQRAAASGPPLRQAMAGDAVIMRDYSKHRQKWAEGVVARRTGPVTYAVKTNDGRVHKRHIDQLLTKNRKSRFSIGGTTHEQAVETNTPDACVVETLNESVTESATNKEELPGEADGFIVNSNNSRTPPTPLNDNNSRLRRRAAIDCANKLKKCVE